MTNNLSEASFV